MREPTGAEESSGMGIVTDEATAARGVAVLQNFTRGEDAPGGAWQGILPSRRATWVLAVVLFATMLVQGMVNPIAVLIDGNYSWSNSIPFEFSVFLLVALFAAQAAAILLATRWPVLATLATMAVYVAAVFVINAPSWVAPMQLTVVASLFLLGSRHAAPVTVPVLGVLILTDAAAFASWASVYGLTSGAILAFVFGQVVGFAASLAAAAVLGLWWGTQTRRVEQLRALAAAERRDQEERLTQAREAERARITQELHDVAAQHITGLLSLTEAAAFIAEQSETDALALLAEARTEARFAAASLVSALNELRATGQARADTTPDVRRIEDLVAFWQRRDLRVSLRTSGVFDSLPAMISTTGYRIAQEALTNAAKHAAGSTAEVIVTATADELEIVVENGPARGATSDSHAVGLGWGLTGLRERVTLLGGVLDAAPTEAGGWRVQSTIPLTDVGRHTTAMGLA
ncbi:ATP-binding protein [Microbacterium sp.]|uniref:sensor histidine kinase n=1 Tax=Microbacterium sp. TaxID=51671 RepID=UPI0026153C95|nr:ATP-binding protein [Microbacterium sp.]